MEMTFFRCVHCGQIVAIVKRTGVPVVCCGTPMQEIIPGIADAAIEKHVPVYEVKGNTVTVSVGAVDHPMKKEHYIEWILVQTQNGYKRTFLKPGNNPEVRFILNDDEKVEAVYAYCNLHSLWKA